MLHVKGKLQTSIAHEYRRKNPSQNVSKLNPILYKVNTSLLNNNGIFL